MGVKIRVSHGKLFLDIYWQGMRKWENLHLSLPTDRKLARETMRLAEITRIKREQQLMAGEYGLQDVLSGKKGLVDYAKTLAADQDSKNPLPKSLKYLSEYAGSVTLGGIDHAWVENYRKHLLSQKALSPSTAAKYLSALRGVIHKAVADKIMIRDPTRDSRGISVPEPETVHLTLYEVEKLAATPLGGKLGGEIKTAFLFGVYTGLRISDLRTLTWGQITHDPPSIEKRQQKTKAIVRIPLHASAWNLIRLAKIPRSTDPVFPLLSKTESNTNQYLKAWAKAADIEKVLGWHVARRTFGTLALQAGGDLKSVSSLLGHKKLTHTAQYLKTDDATQRTVVDAIPELEIQKPGAVVPMKKVEGEK